MESLSERIKNIPESATIAMTAKARDMKQSGIDVISLSIGEPDFKTPGFIVDETIEALKTGKYFS